MELDPSTEEVNPAPDNIFKRILKVSHHLAVLRFKGLTILTHSQSSVIVSFSKRDTQKPSLQAHLALLESHSVLRDLTRRSVLSPLITIIYALYKYVYTTP